MGDIGFGEIMLVLMIALLLYGQDLPKIARKLGTSYAGFKAKMRTMQEDLMREVPEIDVQKEIDQADRPATPPSPQENGPLTEAQSAVPEGTEPPPKA